MATIKLLSEYGNQLREPYSKSMGDGLFELRIKFSSDISRIFYFFIVDNKIILTNGFVKKTVKTPKPSWIWLESIRRTMKGECFMSDFQKHMERLLEDPELRAEYEALQPEMEVIRALIDARIKENLTQKQLAERCGVRQSNISRIESGTCSPTISTLQQLAAGMGKKLRIEFI